jgi:DNA-binding response OmpR family regulator
MAEQDARADLLVVDDTPANLNVLSTILGQRGYRVRPAISGELALKAARAARPDLILLDIQMPGLSGYEVCRQLKAAPDTARVPIVFISALEDAGDKVEAFRAGGADYITKPFQIEEVLARVENQLTLHRQRSLIAALSSRGEALTGETLDALQAGLARINADAEQILAANRPELAHLASSIRDTARALQGRLQHIKRA